MAYALVATTLAGCPGDSSTATSDESSSTDDGDDSTTAGSPTTITTADTTADATETGSTTTDATETGTTTTDATETTTDATETTTDATDSSSTTTESTSSGGPTCGDGQVDDPEPCDGDDLAGEDCVTLGFDAGELACADDCGAFDTAGCITFSCGNGIIEGKESCEGLDLGGQTCESLGNDSGTLSCTENCAFDLAGCGTCGNVITDGDELCDGGDLAGIDCSALGFDSGTLACAPDCSAFDTTGCGVCGNGEIDGDEPCDVAAALPQTCEGLGFDSGALQCTADCSAYDTSQCGTCGNGVADGGESCDGDDLAGQDCASLGLGVGAVQCAADCSYDTSGCIVPFGSDTGYAGYVMMGAPPCDNIVATGTPTFLTDDSNIVVDIGFTFPFYGVDMTQANIMSNGVLRFGDNLYLSYNNTCLPSAVNPSNNNLYVFWDDLNPSSAGASEIYYQTLGAPPNQRFVVQWETAHFGGDGIDLIRVQAMLDEATGRIDVCYPDTLSAGNAGNSGAEATSGIQQSSVDGFDFSCNTPSLVNGTWLQYVPN